MLGWAGGRGSRSSFSQGRNGEVNQEVGGDVQKGMFYYCDSNSDNNIKNVCLSSDSEGKDPDRFFR